MPQLMRLVPRNVVTPRNSMLPFFSVDGTFNVITPLVVDSRLIRSYYRLLKTHPIDYNVLKCSQNVRR